MKVKLFTALICTLLILLLFTIGARADGIIIPEPPICDPLPCPQPLPVEQLAIRYHHVRVSIQDQVAVTHVDQVFYNPNDWAVEGTYLFPLPVDAAVTSFTLWVDGEPVEGKVLDAEQARRTYEQIVSSLRDPALLEYAGRGAVQASIFPIPPDGERRIELEYSQALTADNGLVKYVYPLNTEKFSSQPLESVSISVEVSASSPLRAVYSPTHEVTVTHNGERQAKAGYEASNLRPDRDFALYYSTGMEEAFHVLSYRDPADPTSPDGFFMLLLAPRPEASAQIMPKDVILVLDHSGSMDGEKFEQAQEALRYILNHLNPEDRFGLIAFSTGVEMYASSLRPAAEAGEALPWVNRLAAAGSTDINRALLEAASLAGEAGAERPAYLIFLTDGLPTEGEIESQKIIDNLKGTAPDGLRLFTFGVGYDVDTFLLDTLAQEQHGMSTYVQPGERLDEALSSFYARISTPVMTDLSLHFSGLDVYDLYPAPLPDLFIGSQILVTGRYREGGMAAVTLGGRVSGQPVELHFVGQQFAVDSRVGAGDVGAESLPRLWATRKIGYLLNQIRLKGAEEELVNQVVRLSIRYGIVTPYTSYLVTEPMPLGSSEQDRIASEEYNQLQGELPAPASGAEAVQKAAGEGALANADAAAAPSPEMAEVMRVVGARTFILSEGKWVDTAFDPDRMQTQKVDFLSAAYFDLARKDPALAAAFALGTHVIVLKDGVAFEVVGEGENPAVPAPDTAEESTPAAADVPEETPNQLPATAVPAAASSTNTAVNIPCLAGLLALAPLAWLGARAALRR